MTFLKILNATYIDSKLSKIIRNKVEEVSKIVIPVLFCAFNIVYWPIILVKYFDGK